MNVCSKDINNRRKFSLIKKITDCILEKIKIVDSSELTVVYTYIYTVAEIKT